MSAEQVITPREPRLRRPSIHAAILVNQYHRSRTSSGWAECILADTVGSSSSPSCNGQPSCRASAVATVVLPLPATPVTTSIAGGAGDIMGGRQNVVSELA